MTTGVTHIDKQKPALGAGRVSAGKDIYIVHKLYANYGEMATIRFVRPARRWRETCKKTCINLLLVVIGWLAGLLGKRLVDQEAKLLAEGCRAIPAGHFNFDPGMVEFFGGKDGLNKAVVYQRFMAWIESNRLAGRNMWNGQPHTYNTYEQWAADIRIFHPKTIQKHVKDFEAMGLLSSHQPWKSEGKCVKHYTSPLRLADNPEQMLLGLEYKTPRVGAEDSDLITTQNPTAHKPSTQTAKTTTPTLMGTRTRRAGVVAEFPNHIPNTELPEKKTEIPEARLDPDERDISDQKVTAATAAYTPLIPRVPPCPADDEPTDQDLTTEVETKSSGDTPPVDVPSYAHIFAIADSEVRRWIEREPDRLAAWCAYAAGEEGVKKPGGFVRAAMRGGGMPPKAPRDRNTDGQSYIIDEYADFIEH